ncbi:orotate phosphoribosyltransferase [Candidatus Micrarchaeota archaeon CG1_02_47_40]|nr:MAG: orotate phosphoribosyltransferase [Candidatus Micrarchaeota archaeon CG1_02_47_40]
MEEYKQKFVEFLLKSNALKFGEFTLKSGRISPYFFSTASFYSGSSTSSLASFYADAIKSRLGDKFDIIFGPAYKGISLAVSTCTALFSKYKLDKNWCFDRKEAKTYGDCKAAGTNNILVGAPLKETERIILIDDVLTTGAAKEEAIGKIRAISPKSKITAVFIAFDRQEKDMGGKNASLEFEKKFGAKVHSIISAGEAFEYLKEKGKIDAKIHEAYLKYKKQYGV